MMQLVYLSFASHDLKLDIDSQIENILTEARERNAKEGITGCLIYRSGIFIQLLEGEKEKVQKLLGSIVLDHKRHSNLKVVLKQDVHERIFPDWSMAYKKIDNAGLDLVNSILPWQQLIDTAKDSQGGVPSEKVLQLFEQLKN